MFDKVTRKRFYNAGTGEFSYSHLLPKDYIKVEYLESTGTQWIQTDYCPCSETKITSNCYFTQPGQNGRFFGNGSTYNGKTDTFTVFLSAYNSGAIIFDFADIRIHRNLYKLSIGNHTIVVDKNGIMIADDVEAKIEKGEFVEVKE